MAIELTDDGTMDTVLRCSECREEFRFNYAGIEDDDRRDELLEAAATKYPALDGLDLSYQMQQDAYDAWIADCIEETAAEHACPAVPCEGCGERPQADGCACDRLRR